MSKSTLVIDFYTGIAYKNSTRNDELELSRDYEKPTYGYNYNLFTTKIDAFTQFKFVYNKVDFYLAQSFSRSEYEREG